jgi:hypothetical protein
MAPLIVCALCALVIIKPQEFVPALAGIPLLYALFAAALVTIAVDVIWRRVRPAFAPHIPWVVAFFAWGILTTALKRSEAVELQALNLAIVLAVFGIMSVGLASSFGIRAFAVTFLVCSLAVSGVAIKQGFSPYGCFLGAAEDWEGKGELDYDGRACETVLDCRKDAPVPDGNYRCERVGPWKTASIGGRVRYRGSLADPNELSLMTAMSIPLAFALFQRNKRKREDEEEQRPTPRVQLPLLVSDRLIERVVGAVRAIPVAAIVGAIALVVVLSKSRSGLLVWLIVVGLYFIRRVGAWGVVAGCILAPPMLLLGGRSGDEAEKSSDERIELLREGFEFIRQTKGIGVGVQQFSDESSIGLTAHNAYLLAAAETGLVGMCLFGMAVYLAVKVPVVVWFRRPRVDDTVQRFAPALAISLAGAMVGILFLSWSYKDILYMLFGVSAALYGVARAQDPTLCVRLSLKEAVLVCLAMFALLVVLYLGARILG